MVRKPLFKPMQPQEMMPTNEDSSKPSNVYIPPNRLKPLKNVWLNDEKGEEGVYPSVYDTMKIDIRVNTKDKSVELKTRKDTPDISHLGKCKQFVAAIMAGFECKDAKVLLRMDDLEVESFDIKDVKMLRGEHLSRAIGRLCGKGGKTRFAIENATTTRIVVADTKIHILGAYMNRTVAKRTICDLILGSPAGSVLSKLRSVRSKLTDIPN